MKTALQVDISYDEILSLVKRLPNQEKLKLSEELEKDVIKSKLTRLLKSFKTDDLSLDLITEEVEIVRHQLYDQQNH